MGRQQSTGASNASATTKTFAQKEELLKERAIKRAEHAEAKRVKAEEHHKIVGRIFRVVNRSHGRVSSREMRTFSMESTARRSRNGKSL